MYPYTCDKQCLNKSQNRLCINKARASGVHLFVQYIPPDQAVVA